MPVNDFEKSIQDRLDSLSLEPSDAVWQQVEMRIRKDKRRRRWFIWIPIFAGSLGIGFWFLNDRNISENPISKNHGGIQTPNLPNAKAKDKEKSTGSGNKSVILSTPPSSESVAQNGNDKTKRIRPLKESIGYDFSTSVKKKHRIEINQKVLANNNPQVDESGSAINDDEVSDNPDSADSANSQAGDQSAYSDSKVLNGEKPNTAKETEIKKNGASGPKSRGKEKKPWQWGLQAGLGVSAQSNSIFSAGQASARDLYSSAGFPVSTPQYYASPVESSVAFSLGAFAEKPLTRVLSLELGLMYSNYGSQMEVGKHTDSTVAIFVNSSTYVSVSNYYNGSGSSTSTYHNQYHFVEIPVKMNFRLNPSGKTPFRWELGITPGILLGSSSLQYDDRLNVFYHHNDFLNMFQLGFNTSLSILLFHSSKIPVWIGPEYRNYLTNLTNQKNSNGNHLYYGGIKAAFPIWGRK